MDSRPFLPPPLPAPARLRSGSHKKAIRVPPAGAARRTSQVRGMSCGSAAGGQAGGWRGGRECLRAEQKGDRLLYEQQREQVADAFAKDWIPACAGMTLRDSLFRHARVGGHPETIHAPWETQTKSALREPVALHAVTQD